MERTSSLDLFRGSDTYTSLAFLDGQAPSHEAISGNIAAEGLQPSQALPASMTVSSLHVAAPIQRPSKMLHTSRLAPGFSAWPQAASNPYPSVAMQQPMTARHTFLPLGNSASQHAAGNADCQADSFAALLADDTALGFADDCFRRESDLYLSQDRAVPAETAYHDTAYHDGLQSNDDFSSITEHPQGDIPASAPPSDVALATAYESVPHHSTVAAIAVGMASAQSASLHPPDVAAASQGLASTEPPVITNSATKHRNLPAACADMTTADAHIPGAEPQATHDQLQTANQTAGQAQPDVPDPTQVESQTSTGDGQAHTTQVSASSSPVAASTARDAAANSPGACKSMRFKPAEPRLDAAPLQHSAQTSSQAEGVISPECATAPGDASPHTLSEDGQPHSTDLQATPAEAKADLHNAAVSDSQAASKDCQLQTASQVQGSISQQHKLSRGQAGVVRPKLAVQDYQLPLLQTARGMPGTEAQSQQERRQSTQPAADVIAIEGAHTCVPEGAIVGQHRGGLSGHAEAPVVRHWGHHIVSKVMSAFPSRVQQVPTPSQATPQPAGGASQAASWAATQPAAPSQQLQSAGHLPAECHAGPAQIQTQTAAVESQPPAQLPGAILSSSAHHSPEDALAPQAAMHSGIGNASSETAPMSEAAMPFRRQGIAISASQQQIHHDPHCTPSILQDLRDAAAQDCVHQPRESPCIAAGVSSQQATVEPVQPSQQAFPELQSSRKTTSMQAYRLSTASQSAGAEPLTPGEAVASHAEPPCSQSLAPPALPPLEQAPDAMPVGLGTTAGSDQDRQLAVAGQTEANGSTASAVHSDGLSTAPMLAAAVTAVEEKQPVVRSQRLSEKKAAAACAQAAAQAAAQADAQAAADADVQAAAQHEQDMLAVAVKQTGFGLASRVELMSSTVPMVLAECLASNRSKRVPGGDPLEAEPFRRFVDMVRSNSHEFEAQGRVLRLKQYISTDVRPAAINAILEALAVNTLVEVLYIQNFEQGMFDEQLLRLTEVLKKGRIWALNAGENFEISLQAWETFTKELQHTAVAYMYVSEHHLARTDLKRRMQDAIRDNRRQAPRRDNEVIKCVGNMWWNPKLHADARPGASRAQGGESALAPLARDMAASQAGSRHSGSGSQSRKRKLQPVDTAVSSQGEGSCPDSCRPLQKHPKRPRSVPHARAASPHTRETGSIDSQAEVSLGEKRSRRIKRRQQQQTGGPNSDGGHTTHSQDNATAAASSPVPSLNRTPESHPRGRGRRPKALGSRSRLANQSGPASDDSESADLAAATEVAVDHFEGEASPSTALTEKPEAARTAQKRKRQQHQQQQSMPAAAIATSVQLTRSTEASNRPDADAMTEHSRSSEAATPSGTHQRRVSKSETVFKKQQQHQELDSEQTGSLRRTGRQRKLTPAAAAAVQEFPSLYRNPPKPPPTAQKAKTVRNSSSLNPESDEDWHQDLEGAAAAATPRRGQAKQMHAASGAAVSYVQMSQLVRCGVLPAGTHELLFKGQPCEVEVLSDGDILFQGELYDTLAKFGRAVLEETGSSKQSCNAWRDLTWQGQRLEALRHKAYVKSLQAKRVQKK